MAPRRAHIFPFHPVLNSTCGLAFNGAGPGFAAAAGALGAAALVSAAGGLELLPMVLALSWLLQVLLVLMLLCFQLLLLMQWPYVEEGMVVVADP